MERGDRVVVVKGRKVPVGTEGTIFWVGTSNYGFGRRKDMFPVRVGFKTDKGETFWTARSNVEHLIPEVVESMAYGTGEFISKDGVPFCEDCRGYHYEFTPCEPLPGQDGDGRLRRAA